MTDLALRPSKALNPTTGELLDLPNEPTDVLAEHRKQVQDFIYNGAREFIRALDAELLARADLERTWTVEAGRFVVEMDGPGRTEIDDPEALYEDLMSLVAHGELTEAAVLKGVEPTTVYKAKKAGLNALKKPGGLVAEVIERHEQPTAKPRGVRVQAKKDRIR